MATEVKRNNWSQFLRRFNAANQYRHAEISLKDSQQEKRMALNETPFLGMTIEKKGRLIGAIQLFAGNVDPDRPSFPVLSIKDPAKITLEKDAEGRDREVTVTTKDGGAVHINLGRHDQSLPEQFVRKVAYTLYERRGRQDGHDQEDWFRAEKTVKDTELDFVR